MFLKGIGSRKRRDQGQSSGAPESIVAKAQKLHREGRILTTKVPGQGERGGEDSAPGCLTAGCSGLQQGSSAEPHRGVKPARALHRMVLGWEKS